jgi:hypothetical protein
VIRLPGVLIEQNGAMKPGSFQTVVMAETEAMAWEVAMGSDVWERIPWEVSDVQVFPKIPLSLPDDHHSPCKRS